MSLAERTLSINVSAAPSWVIGRPSLQWFKLAQGTGSGFDSGARIAQVKPVPTPYGSTYPQPALTAYSGGAVDQARGQLLVCGGGHFSYAGNEVYAFNARAAVPGWERLCDPSPGCFTGSAYGGIRSGWGQYDGDVGINGAPHTPHTWNHLCVQDGKLWLPALGGMQEASAKNILNESGTSDSQGTDRIFWFDLADREWHAGAFWQPRQNACHDYHVGYCQSGSFAVESQNAVYSYLSNSTSDTALALIKIDAASGMILNRWYQNQTGGFWSAAVTPIPGTTKVIARGNNVVWNDPGINLWDAATPLANYKATQLVVNDLTDGTVAWTNEVCGAVWHAPSGALLVGQGCKSKFVKIKPDTPGNYAGSWTATTITPSDFGQPGAISPSNGYDSVYLYGRWNLINDMGDEGGGMHRSMLVCLLDMGQDDPTYAMLLPPQGV